MSPPVGKKTFSSLIICSLIVWYPRTKPNLSAVTHVTSQLPACLSVIYCLICLRGSWRSGGLDAGLVWTGTGRGRLSASQTEQNWPADRLMFRSAQTRSVFTVLMWSSGRKTWFVLSWGGQILKHENRSLRDIFGTGPNPIWRPEAKPGQRKRWTDGFI